MLRTNKDTFVELLTFFHTNIRVECRLDTTKASEDTIVLTVDFSQNLTLPSVPDTPSGWYFLSLISVSLFGVYCANTHKHHSYIYTERKGGKGANKIASMLHNVIEQQGLLDVEMEQAARDDQGAAARKKTLILWADNCCGQNKNSFVLWYLMFLVQYDIFANVSLKFLVKGHTKKSLRPWLRLREETRLKERVLEREGARGLCGAVEHSG